MPTHFGFADISCWILLASDPRQAAFTFGVAADGKTAEQVWTAVKDSLNLAGGIKTRLSTNATFARIRVSLATDGADDVVYDLPCSIGGSGGSANLPPNCALLVHKRTQRGGRRGRGRLFMPWMLNEADVTENGSIGSAAVTAIQTAFTNWYVDLSARGVPMYLLHQEGETAPGLPTAVTSLAIDPLVSTQRRRLHR